MRRTSKFRRKFLTIVLLFNAFFVAVLFISSYHTTNRIKLLKKNLLLRNKTLLKRNISTIFVTDRDEITILFWTKYFENDPLSSKGEESLQIVQSLHPACFEKCRVVTDQNYLGFSDAVIFHSRDMRRDEMPPVHPSNQIWIYLQHESPSNTRPDLTEFANVFNWTMTYRQDSDVYYPYGRISRSNGSLIQKPFVHVEDVKQKTKLVLWIVSNCYTKGKRERLVEELERYIPVDIYGDCGEMPCSRNAKEGCLPQLAHQYKFYLSFENSLCSEYATEKLFGVLKHNLVPIVYGGADYDALAPPNSFINVNRFNSMEALANYLKYLDKNPEKYLEYFKWKLEYKVDDDASWRDGWCNLCAKLQKQRRNPKKKIYGNLWKWWHYMKTKSPPQNNEGKNDGEKFFTFPEGNYAPVCQDGHLQKVSIYDIFHIMPIRRLKRLYHRIRGY